MITADGPEVLCIGQPRLTAGLDRLPRINLTAHQRVFGPMPRVSVERLVEMAAQVDLRGRGGAAFPVARKISAVLDSCRRRGRAPVIVVNGTEGEPGSAKDRVLLLRSPNLVLAGALAAAWALQAKEVVVGVTDAQVAESVRHAAAAEPALRRLIRVFAMPDRFVSGEAGALISALNGRAALPPGRRTHASEAGVGGRPTLLSNAETFAQLAVLVMAGPEGYASSGLAAEPGTVLLTVGGAAARPAVVEVPTGLPLGEVLDLCGARSAEGVLVGGYHGAWLHAEHSYAIPVSRTGLAAAGGTLGAGIVLALGADTCPLGEVARVAGYLAKESSGQCGPCKLGLPSIARSLTALADGSGGVDALEMARRAAAAVRGRGACAHPDGVFRFVLSALDVFADDVAAHAFRGSCARPVRGYLPVPPHPGEARLSVDWTRCRGHGLCAHIVPELMQLDRQGYPVLLDMPVPPWLEGGARQAVSMCPALALRLNRAAKTAPSRSAAQPSPAARPGRMPAKAPRASSDTVVDLVVSEDWIAEITGIRSPAEAGRADD